ncbi:D-alanyl-D-alanine carboxypeptidase [Streptomyces sp. NBRC 14336]|uniref:D-alanyl-D-alanine carboxypeptidase n=1 Tax=Streptomyces sp. NBRC 14336 TaxID=3030992 RepID=UPI0024A5B9B5|nr:D-alanyl-D-alanine carboxypeptidase [Streptomyces sp. NBRC 14336]GLW51151.1 D-alanyl-D-alanine carboxypeptidase [Streptomyces sp. NBRC 14336]
MAGESPDSSKQRESSAEPTSGSAGSVPEARNQSADPRLAITRAGVDTATRVLSPRDLAAARAAESDTDTDTDSDTDTDTDTDTAQAESTEDEPKAEGGSNQAEAESAEARTDARTEAKAEAKAEAEAEAAPRAESNGDDRLRAAVAAWVATGDSGAGGAGGEADSGATGGSGASTDREGTDGSASSAEEDAGADGDDAATAVADAEPGADAEVEPEVGPEDEGPRADAEPEDASEDEDADAAPVADAAPSGGTKAPVSGATLVMGVKPGSGAEPKADAVPKADTTSQKPEPPAKVADAKPTTDGHAADAQDSPAAKGAVDQPTTALRFVPLKSDIRSEAAPEARPAARPTTGPGTGPGTAPAARPAPAPEVTTAVPQVGPERTAQQPLPPKPPLDLLAELTNTPPPPETPVRTLVRRVKIWTPLVLLLAIVFAVVQSMRPLPEPTLDLTAQESFTFEGDKVDIPWPSAGQAALDVQGIGSFGSSGEQKPVPIASVAKVMTAYVILRDHPLKSGEAGPKIEIDQAAEDQSDAGQESTVDVFAGDSITEREALQSILIASANNVARLLARWDAGSEEAFVKKMNAAAKDLGMSDTTYTDPSGLNDSTVSTAVDQVKLAKAAMEMPAFREVAAMMSYDDYKGKNHGNWNQLVGKNNVVGIKTGTTTSALGNLVFAAKQEVGGETRTIIGAVVRQPDTGQGILAAALDSGDQLIRAAQGALESVTVLKKGDVVGYVDDGLGGRTPVVATKDVKAAGWSGLKVELDFAADEVPHEAKAGTKVGTLTVGDGGTAGAVKVPVALQTDLVEPGFTDKLIRLG